MAILHNVKQENIKHNIWCNCGDYLKTLKCNVIAQGELDNTNISDSNEYLNMHVCVFLAACVTIEMHIREKLARLLNN